jgi:hypothetical protein
MPAERQDICLGNDSRERREAKLTFKKRRSEMLRHKVQRMEGP